MDKNFPDIGDYLIQKIYEKGVRHVFGVPGDYILNFYSKLEKSQLRIINTCDEQGAGFAADAYARVHGLGVVCVTYNVGGLKVLNPAAGAYAEKSPLLIIAGSPGWQEREKYPLLHHKPKEYDDQYKMFERITVASSDFKDPALAYTEIDRVLDEILRQKRPGYLELPRDIVDLIPNADISCDRQTIPGYDRQMATDAAAKIVAAVNASKQPVIVAGVEIARNNLEAPVLGFAEKTNIPVVSTILGKSAVDEKNPHYLGVYAGIVGDDEIRRYVESADCIILIGVLMTDVNLGANTAVLDRDKMIMLSEEDCIIGRRSCNVPGLALIPEIIRAELTKHDTISAPLPVRNRMPAFSPANKKITTAGVFLALNSYLDEKSVLITEVGDALMMSIDITIKRPGGFMSPAYYSSLGFAVPAAIGVQAASSDSRAVVLTGDGAFQMAGMEISTAGRYGMNPIIIVLNNSGFGTERPMIDGAFNDVATWHYHKIPEIIDNGRGFLIKTENEFVSALKEAYQSDELSVLEVILESDDISPQLRRLCQHFAKGVNKMA